MRATGREGVRRGRTPVTTRPADAPDAHSDVVETGSPLNTRTSSGSLITYVRILTGLCDAAFITNAYSWRIIDWAVSASLHYTPHGSPLARPRACTAEHGSQPHKRRP